MNYPGVIRLALRYLMIKAMENNIIDEAHTYYSQLESDNDKMEFLSELKDKMLECSEFDGWYIYDLDEKGICDKIQELEEFYDECKNILLCLMAVATGEHQQGEQSFANVVEEYMNDLSKIEN